MAPGISARQFPKYVALSQKKAGNRHLPMFCDNAILNMDPGYSIEGTGLPVSIRQAVLIYESFSAFKAIALR